ncbi:STAS domain-containing protein [Streptomyces sp. SP17BM10]|uniref:STAS domain-containing protein n=1 Tax=Streptomyces sp. SP17BM10 TaxID=3002530 RepID=UPI002E79D28F|nr:STAS domain-containing protein [Streptomyces sp. SP17BM10]
MDVRPGRGLWDPWWAGLVGKRLPERAARAVPAPLAAVGLAAAVTTGAKLVPVRWIAALGREHRGEAVVLVVTAGSIIVTDLSEGVLIGVGLAVVKAAWQTSHLQIRVEGERLSSGEALQRVRLSGNATFLRLPRLLDALERLPADRPVELDWSDLRHLGHACTVALASWAPQRRARSTAPLAVEPPLPTRV